MGELNFDKSFLHYNEKKKMYSKACLNLTLNMKYQILLGCKKFHHVRHTSLTFTRVKLCTYNKFDVNGEPSHLWYSIFRAGGIQLASVLSSVFSFYQDTSPKVVGFLETFRNTIYLETILATSATMRSLKLKKKTVSNRGTLKGKLQVSILTCFAGREKS